VWNCLVADGDAFMVGNIPVKVMLLPGHRLVSITYVAGDAVFVHDALMIPDSGNSCADFPGVRFAELYNSILLILVPPIGTRVCVVPEYAPGRDATCNATLTQHLASNIHWKKSDVRGGIPRGARCPRCDFVLPKLTLAALQVYTCGGPLLVPENNERAYLKCRWVILQTVDP
jgi:hypothetical protein